jgi:hypothetical protein
MGILQTTTHKISPRSALIVTTTRRLKAVLEGNWMRFKFGNIGRIGFSELHHAGIPLTRLLPHISPLRFRLLSYSATTGCLILCELLIISARYQQYRRDIYNRARKLWNSGATAKMRHGNNDVIDVLEQILATLVGFYPIGHFDHQEPHVYINTISASRHTWHWSRLEPNGQKTGGTIVGIIAGGCVIDDLEEMVLELVSELAQHLQDLEYDRWKSEWDAVGASPTSRISS